MLPSATPEPPPHASSASLGLLVAPCTVSEGLDATPVPVSGTCTSIGVLDDALLPPLQHLGIPLFKLNPLGYELSGVGWDERRLNHRVRSPLSNINYVVQLSVKKSCVNDLYINNKQRRELEALYATSRIFSKAYLPSTQSHALELLRSQNLDMSSLDKLESRWSAAWLTKGPAASAALTLAVAVSDSVMVMLEEIGARASRARAREAAVCARALGARGAPLIPYVLLLFCLYRLVNGIERPRPQRGPSVMTEHLSSFVYNMSCSPMYLYATISARSPQFCEHRLR
ncbi:hypothetical protein C8Q78DRAFT_591044 [Trametes maxima]|nr:hypothetical protein C8Q78DRAFT_591044 [Trametes maxima]